MRRNHNYHSETMSRQYDKRRYRRELNSHIPPKIPEDEMPEIVEFLRNDARAMDMGRQIVALIEQKKLKQFSPPKGSLN
jgi:hypothetical protein